MAALIKMELGKLMRKPFFWISLAALFFFCMETYFGSVNPLGSGLWGLTEDGALLYGREVIRQELETAERYRGILTDDKVEQILRDELWNETQMQTIVQMALDPDPRKNRISFRMSDVYRIVTYYLMTIQPLGDESWLYFYGEDEFCELGDVFPESAMPLNYEYAVHWGGMLQSIIECVSALILFMILVVSPVFSEERVRKTNQLLFTSRFGRWKCFWAKTAAVYILGGAAVMGILLLLALGTVLPYHAKGLGCSIQLIEPFWYQDYPFAKTVGSVIVDAAVLSVAGLFFAISLTVLVSALAKNVLNAVILSFALFVSPVILLVFPIAEQVKLIAPINRLTDFAGVLLLPDVRIGNFSIQYSYVIAGILMLAAIGITLCTALIFRNQSDE